MATPKYSLSQIIAAPAGLKPWYDYWVSGWEWVQSNAGDVSALQAGSTPGWGAAIDSRWIASTVGTNAYSANLQQSPSASDNLIHGMVVSLDVSNRNTVRQCTLNVGSIEGDVPIKVVSNFGLITNPYVGDLKSVHQFKYNGNNATWICLDPQGYKRTILAAEMGVDNGAFANSASPDNIGRIATFSFPAGAEYACWLRPLVLPDATVDYIIECNMVLETAETGKNIQLQSHGIFYSAGGDWSKTTPDESGTDDDISVPDDAASRFTHIGVNMKIPAADLVEDNMYASVAIVRDDATTGNHGGKLHLIDVFVREGA